jgi:hypothetical protein
MTGPQNAGVTMREFLSKEGDKSGPKIFLMSYATLREGSLQVINIHE